MGLDDEDVGPPDRLTESRVQLPVGELGEIGIAQFDTEALRDLLGQREVGTPGDEVQPLLGDEFHSVSFVVVPGGHDGDEV